MLIYAVTLFPALGLLQHLSAPLLVRVRSLSVSGDAGADRSWSRPRSYRTRAGSRCGWRNRSRSSRPRSCSPRAARSPGARPTCTRTMRRCGATRCGTTRTAGSPTPTSPTSSSPAPPRRSDRRAERGAAARSGRRRAPQQPRRRLRLEGRQGALDRRVPSRARARPEVSTTYRNYAIALALSGREDEARKVLDLQKRLSAPPQLSSSRP